MEPPLCVVSNWIIRVYTILVWNTISLILMLIFHLKVLINFFFFFIIIIIIINSIICIIIINTTTTSIIIIIIIIVIVIVIVDTIAVVLLLFIIYIVNSLWFDPGLAGLFITSILLHLGEDINFLVVSSFWRRCRGGKFMYKL